MVEIELIENWVSIGAGVATVLVVYLLWKTVKQMEETAKLSKVQVAHRFRPWVGPSSGVEFMRAAEGKEQFVITIKNYGELPASNVSAMCAKTDKMPNRDILRSEGVDKFNLGPLLPNMEKRYWFFIDSDAVRNTKNGDGQIFVAIYFGYEYPGGRSGYGMISHFDAKTNTFAHKDMWVD
ncbi:MAG: hypothetical protein ACRD5H_02970 [Nitrososphaerales archaeon]